jgi:hypothetical protein
MLTNRLNKDTTFLLQRRDTSTLSNRINLKVNISDTSTMLSNYFRKTDTATMLSNRLKISDTATMLSNRLKSSDTATMLVNRLKISDTLTMHANYLRKSDTAFMLVNRLKISDTSSMLLNRLKISDTSTMLTNRLKISDTATMLTNRIKKDTSFLLQKSDTAAFANRIIANSIRDVTFEVAYSGSSNIFTLATLPSANTKIKMYVNGVRISNTAYGYVTDTGGATTSATPTLYIKYTPANNGAYVLVAGDRIQMDYYY